MKKRILDYMAMIDGILEKEDENTDYEALKKEHLVQIMFFMHERQVHLFVTLTFALLAFADFFLMVLCFQPGLLILFVALLVLLVPYIMHYYLLENGVQKMYRQYDEITSRLTKTSKKADQKS